MQELDVLKQIGSTPSKNDKIRLLQANDTPTLRKLLFLTYNRFMTYRVKQLDFPKHYNTVQPDMSEELNKILTLLAKHETGTNEAKALLKNMMSHCTEEGAQWVAKIVTRDLKIGIDESSINKAFPNLLPEFKVQLCTPIFKGGDNPKNYWPTVKYPVIVEQKYDGCRAICIVRDGKVSFYSREGHAFDHKGAFEREILKLRPGTDYVLDGEIIAIKFNPNHKIFIKNKDHGWEYEGGKSMWISSDTTKEELEEYVGFFCWDVLELDAFESFGKSGKRLSLTERKMQLCGLFERTEYDFKNLFQVPNYYMKSEEEVRSLFRSMRDKPLVKHTVTDNKGKEVEYTDCQVEGLMLKIPTEPYEFKRGINIFKVKEFNSADLRVVSAYQGKEGTKNSTVLGGLSLVSDCGKFHTDCGSGFDDAQRWEIWQEYIEGGLVGKIVEITYQECTSDGSLRFPVFVRTREEKNTTNVE